ncbi:MAG: DUF2007 domain-containing protein [Anaerovoracaceae bacterium]
MRPKGWKIVCEEQGLANAGIVAGRLEAEGIPVHLDYEVASIIYGLTLDGLGRVNVLVPEDRLAAARRILEETYQEEDLDWRGEGNPGK